MCKLMWHQLQAAEADAGLEADLLAGALPLGASECMSGLCQGVWHFPQAVQADVEADAGLDAELLAGALPEAGGDAAVLREGLAVSAGGWPLARCRPPTMLCYHDVLCWSTTRAETRGLLPAVERAMSSNLTNTHNPFLVLDLHSLWVFVKLLVPQHAACTFLAQHMKDAFEHKGAHYALLPWAHQKRAINACAGCWRGCRVTSLTSSRTRPQRTRRRCARSWAARSAPCRPASSCSACRTSPTAWWPGSCRCALISKYRRCIGQRQ